MHVHAYMRIHVLCACACIGAHLVPGAHTYTSTIIVSYCAYSLCNASPGVKNRERGNSVC